MLSDIDLKEAKAEAKRRFGHIRNVVGFGIGENCILIYIRDNNVKNEIPSDLNKVPIEFVITDDIKPFAETA